MSAVADYFQAALFALAQIDDAIKRTAAHPCECGAELYVYRGRHSGQWLLRHPMHQRCPFDGKWLAAASKDAVLSKWTEETREQLPF